ncbi:hypothetical protein [Psychroflexus sp. ALD_RP9]|uniref:hypothetical protein n=1 Tax=Psychroflexus sp. ALD_RP9 TaxID=2777186 RepID=UPI001A8E870D|nr:hypothetical protein [Psychroflexus sp. ALD_RP9]QSS96608.1 hypothetical protein IMZ30_09160 [Psychroflexus sp. ALD_RP9]
MAYNKINYYKRIIEIQELTLKLHNFKNMYYKEIYWQHIEPKYHISYRTFHEYLGIPAARELKKLNAKKPQAPSFFDDCKHEHTHKKSISSHTNCETTAIFCLDCGRQLSQPKTDC